MHAWRWTTAVPPILAVAGCAAIAWWLSCGPLVPLEARVPGMDRAGAGAEAARPLVAELRTGSGKPSADAGAWPCFRGLRHDAIGDDGTPLARSWPAGRPPILWSIDVGEGYAGAAIWKGRVYLLDYDRAASSDVLRCLSLADGQEIWRLTYPVAIKRNHGMSRTVPAVVDRAVVTLGPKCHLLAAEPESGKVLWLRDMVADFAATVPPWYAGQCPLVDGDRVIVAPGGSCLMAALDLRSGRPIWTTPNPRGWTMTHVSVVPMEFAGRRMYVYCGKGGVAGVSADDGRLLWETTDWKINIATVPSPVPLANGKIFFSGGYNAGALLLELKDDGGRIAAATLRRLKPSQFGATQQTPILFDGHLFGVREKDKELVCLTSDGKVVWQSGSQHRFGLGPYLVGDGLIYALDDSGKLTMAEASAKGFRPLAAAQVLDGHDAWGPMALAGGKLIVRDFTRMACLDVSKH